MQQGWFFLAILGPLLYAATNHIDKGLLERYFKEGGVGTLLLFSFLLSALPAPVFFAIDQAVLDVNSIQLLTLVAVGVLHALLLFFYLKALEGDEATIVIVFYQLVPVMGLILGYLVLGETLNRMQVFAMIAILVGTTIIAFEVNGEGSVVFRTKTVIYMLLAGFCWALGDTLFKVVALQQSVVRSLFWEHIVLGCLGIMIYAFVPTYRSHFKAALKENSRPILSLNLLNEGLYIAANVIMAFPLVVAQVALVLLVDTFQPVFVLLIGILLTIFVPKWGRENIDKKHLGQKIAAIGITGLGVLFLLNS